MSVGLPIISYNFKTGISTILKEGVYGVLVETNDVKKLSDEMKRLAENANIRSKYSKLSLSRIKKYNNSKLYMDNF